MQIGYENNPGIGTQQWAQICLIEQKPVSAWQFAAVSIRFPRDMGEQIETRAFNDDMTTIGEKSLEHHGDCVCGSGCAENPVLVNAIASRYRPCKESIVLRKNAFVAIAKRARGFRAQHLEKAFRRFADRAVEHEPGIGLTGERAVNMATPTCAVDFPIERTHHFCTVAARCGIVSLPIIACA